MARRRRPNAHPRPRRRSSGRTRGRGAKCGHARNLRFKLRPWPGGRRGRSPGRGCQTFESLPGGGGCASLRSRPTSSTRRRCVPGIGSAHGVARIQPIPPPCSRHPHGARPPAPALRTPNAGLRSRVAWRRVTCTASPAAEALLPIPSQPGRACEGHESQGRGGVRRGEGVRGEG